MNIRKILFIIVIVVIVVLLAYLGFRYFSSDNTASPTNINAGGSGQGQLPGGSGLPSGGEGETYGSGSGKLTATEQNEADMVNTAKYFVAAIGTYSPDGNFQNVSGLKPLMTNRMKDWADNFVARNLGGGQSESVTTSVFKTEIMSSSGNAARVMVYTRRNIMNNEGEKTVNQDAEVRLIKIGENWLIDELNWE